jgi:hypothetical protein
MINMASMHTIGPYWMGSHVPHQMGEKSKRCNVFEIVGFPVGRLFPQMFLHFSIRCNRIV